MRRPVPKIPEQSLLALRFGPKLQDLLFPHEIEGQGCRHGISELLGCNLIKAAREFGEKDRVTSLVRLDEPLPGGSFQREIMVFQVIDLPLEQWVVRKYLEDAERLSPHGQDVHAPILVTFYDVHDFRGAAHAHHALRERQQHPEWRLLLQTVAHHSAVARFEDVQGKLFAGEEYDVEWKKRNSFRPHEYHAKGYQKVSGKAARWGGSRIQLKWQCKIQTVSRSGTAY